MRMKHVFLILTMVLMAASLPAASEPVRDARLSTCATCSKKIPFTCTVFTVSKGDQVFFGGNDDYINPDSYYWVDQGNSGNYGAIWIGLPDNVQQGVNEKGLAYDANGLPRVEVNPHSERLAVSGGYSSYPIQILHECATVEEVIAWAKTHVWHSYMHDQMHFADATGDAVVISAGKDGELVFTRKPAGDGFLVSTNFNVANPANGYGYPDWRYDRAQELLGQILKTEGQLTAADSTRVLEAVHVGGGTSWTIESLLADLPHGVVYLYYFHQFDRPVVLNVREEIANPRTPGPLSALFPEDVRQEATRRYEQIQAKARLCKTVGMTWLGIVLISLALLFILPAKGPRGLRLWVPATILLGLLALLAWLVVRPGRKQARWRTALEETIGDIIPTVLGFVVTLVVIILLTVSKGAAPQLIIILILCLPLAIGWLIFQGPLLAPVSRRSFGRFLIQRLPHVLVATNLGLAGITIPAMPLVNRSIQLCPVLPFSIWPVLGWWAIAALGSVVGSVLLFFYEARAVKNGYQAWSVLARREGEVSTPSWRKLWRWILLSYAVLVGWFAISVILQRVMTN